MLGNKEFLNIVKNNPDLPVIPMVNWEICQDDTHYWLGSFDNCRVDSYSLTDEKVVFYSDFSELVDEYIEYHYNDQLSDEENENIAKERVSNYDWVKAIIVNIELPED